VIGAPVRFAARWKRGYCRAVAAAALRGGRWRQRSRQGSRDKLDVEFSLGSLMRANGAPPELTINGMALDLGLDPQGRIDWPASTGKFNLGRWRSTG